MKALLLTIAAASAWAASTEVIGPLAVRVPDGFHSYLTKTKGGQFLQVSRGGHVPLQIETSGGELKIPKSTIYEGRSLRSETVAGFSGSGISGRSSLGYSRDILLRTSHPGASYIHIYYHSVTADEAEAGDGLISAIERAQP